MLRKKTPETSRSAPPRGILAAAAGRKVDRRGFLRGSGLAIGGLAAISATGGTVRRAEAQAVVVPDDGARQVGLHPLLGRLHRDRRGLRRRLGRPGARLGQPVQHGRALRQGCELCASTPMASGGSSTR